MINKSVVLCLLGVLSFTQIAECQTRTPSTTIVDTIPFELTSHNNISIKAVFGKVDTVNLMFHTAASSMTLTTEATKRLKSINWDSETNVNSWGGASTARYSESNFLKIGKLQWDSIAIWENKNSGPTTDGKFGPNLFEGYAIEINFDKSLITLHSSLPKKAEEFVKMQMVCEDENMFLHGVSTIDGVDYPNQFLVHSGYGGTILFDDNFVLESQLGDKIEIIDEKKLKDSYDNTILVRKGVLPQFMIAEVELLDVTVGFFQGKIGMQQMSIIGGDMIKRFNIIIDSKREFMYLKTNQFTNTAYSQI